jgi:hypothetical protein
MADPTGEADKGALRLDFDRRLILQFRGSAITGYVLPLIPGYEGVDWGLPFGVNGDRAGPMQTVGRLPIATLGLKRGDMRFGSLLRDTPIRAIGTERATQNRIRRGS